MQNIGKYEIKWNIDLKWVKPKQKAKTCPYKTNRDYKEVKNVQADVTMLKVPH